MHIDIVIKHILAEHKNEKRRLAQMIIDEIGATGPEDLEQTVKRAIEEIRRLKYKLKNCCSDCAHQN